MMSRHDYTPAEISRERAAMRLLKHKAKVRAWLKNNPQVGVLIRKGEEVYYVYPAGGEFREIEALTEAA
tara:strand:- start:36 stop:242 length:207 start_codon:yes stop_codon:yes gene_type:complete